MRLLFFLGLVWVLALPGWAQEPVRNVRIRVINDSSQLEIRYDLMTRQPGDSIYVSVRSRSRGVLLILPEFVRGDLGKRVTTGSDRRIVWDAVANGYLLQEDVRATVFVKSNQSSVVTAPAVSADSNGVKRPVPVTESDKKGLAQRSPDQRKEAAKSSAAVNPAAERPDTVRPYSRQRYAGPAWALLSAVAPGMGNIFVQQPKPKVGLRSLVTIGCYGLLVYGLTERQKSDDDYARYEQQKSRTAAEPYYQTANRHHQRYYLATRGALLVTAADVILTLIRGAHNQRERRRAQGVTLRPGLQAGQPTAVVRWAF